MTTVERIKACVSAVPEVVSWPELTALFDRAASRPRPDWEWPLIACRAVGGKPDTAVCGAAAIACMYLSIILVDDMLDEDPRGEYHRSGAGPTANLALAFQATAFRVVEQTTAGLECRAAVLASLACLALSTALGQHLDTQNLDGEGNYWRVVRAKSTPFYGAALHVGALLGGATQEVAEQLRSLGVLLGEVIQIHDDLLDTFQTPASPDWMQGRPSLPILYARTADHPDRLRFVELLPQVGDPRLLREAQQILIRSGAVSYCTYHLVERHRQAQRLLAQISFVDPSAISVLLGQLMQPLIALLRTVGADLPSELGEWVA